MAEQTITRRLSIRKRILELIDGLPLERQRLELLRLETLAEARQIQQ